MLPVSYGHWIELLSHPDLIIWWIISSQSSKLIVRIAH